MALAATAWIASPGQVTGAASASATMGVASQQSDQRHPEMQLPKVGSAENAGQAAAQSPADPNSQADTPRPEAANNNSGQVEGRVETASLLPDSASLLPVAAVVGFSFLLGGIVCGTIKSRH
jgi:hypothetical protein